MTSGAVDGRARLRWLATDFGSRSFLAADTVEEIQLNTQGPEGAVQVGVLALRFSGCSGLAAARKAVDRSGRHNFLLPALTVFRVRSNGHQLAFVLSETPLARPVMRLFADLEARSPANSECKD